MWRTIDQMLRGYQVHEVALELAVIWICVYLVFRFLRGTRGASVIKGVALLLVIVTLSVRLLGQGSDAFDRLDFIYDRFLALLTVFLIVVFQPELRQAMIRIGRTRLLGAAQSSEETVIEAVSEAVEFLSKSQFGALIAIERDTKLGGLMSSGEQLDARVSARLLETIFWPNNPLHDLGVVIRDDRIMAANVLFPVVDDAHLPPRFGARHRAAAGLTLDADAIVVVVSEERGSVSIAENGVLEFDVPRDQVRQALTDRLRTPTPRPESADRGEVKITEADHSADAPVEPAPSGGA